jgi:hypothetical protein
MFQFEIIYRGKIVFFDEIEKELKEKVGGYKPAFLKKMSMSGRKCMFSFLMSS